MNEKPLEWMTECGEGIGHKVGRMVSLALTIVFFVLFILSMQIFAVIGLAIFGVIYFLLQRSAFVEYEFNYFSDDMDIAAIYNRARRKKKMSFSLGDVEYMVKKIEPQEVTRYFCNKDNPGNTYTIVLNLDGKRTAVVLEPEPEFVKLMEMKRKVR